MQETKTTESSTGGKLEDVDFPRSDIYVSANINQKKEMFKYHTKEGSFHFFLMLNAGVHYTQEQVEHCNGYYDCYNCGRAIMENVYMYPEEITARSETICSPLPHCRPSCCLRTVEDIPNNHDLKACFFFMYGGNIRCAPPRMLLYIPGRLTLEEYHDTIDNSLVVQQETNIVRSFMAPTFLSCTFLKDHQLVPDVMALIEEMSIESKTAVGPGRTRDNNHVNIVNLSTTDLTKTGLSKTFVIDPSSFRS